MIHDFSSDRPGYGAYYNSRSNILTIITENKPPQVYDQIVDKESRTFKIINIKQKGYGVYLAIVETVEDNKSV